MAITLRELDGMSYEEIAAIMDCPVGTVRSRIFRAREAIDNKSSTANQALTIAEYWKGYQACRKKTFGLNGW